MILMLIFACYANWQILYKNLIQIKQKYNVIMRTFRQTLQFTFNSFQSSNISTKQNESMIPLMSRGTQALKQQLQRLKDRLSKPSYEKMHKLNDLSFIQKTQSVAKLDIVSKYLDNRLKLFHPDSGYLFVWNCLVILSLLFNFYQIPVSTFLTEKVYSDQFSYAPTIFLNVLILVILLVDMGAVRPNLAFFQNGQLVTYRYKIIRKYMQFQLYLDGVSIFVLFLYIAADTRALIYLKFLFYAKIYHFLKTDRQISNYLQIYRIKYALYQFARMCFFLIFVIVWVASIYFAIDFDYYVQKGYYYNSQQTWLNGSGSLGNIDVVQDLPWMYWLSYAIYFAMQITATIGYGICTPRNPRAIMYASFVMILMTVLFALFINTVWGIIQDLQVSGTSYFSNWTSLNSILQSKKISPRLNSKVSDYFHEIWKYHQKKLSSQIDSNLSQNLKKQLYSLSSLQIFDSMPIFINWEKQYPQEWQKFKSEIFSFIQTVELAEDQVLMDKNSLKTYLYCVLRGRILLRVNDNYIQKLKHVYKKNDKIGQEQFFLDYPIIFTAKAQCFSRVSRIQKTKFIECLRKFSNLHRQYVKNIQTLRFSPQRQSIDVKCWFCCKKPSPLFPSLYHSSYECPVKNFWRDKIIVRKDKLQNLSKLKLGQQKQRVHYRNFIKSNKVFNKNFFQEIQIDKISLEHQEEDQRKIYKNQLEMKNINKSRFPWMKLKSKTTQIL